MENVFYLDEKGNVKKCESPTMGTTYFHVTEQIFQKNLKDYGKLTVSILLMRVLDTFRFRINEPVILTSFNRSQDHQEKLVENPNYYAARFSTHVENLAADFTTKTLSQLHYAWKETKNEKLREATISILKNHYLKTLNNVAADMGIRIRIGMDEYINKGQTLFHVDVAPEYYREGRCWNYKSHPEAWERAARW